MRYLLTFSMLALVCLFMPSASEAGWLDIFKSSTIDVDNKSECGKQIDIFHHFMHDGRICKKDDDCMEMEGSCPLGCKFYINRNFESIIDAEVDKVQDKCDSNICPYKCPQDHFKAVCFHNSCRAGSKIR
jgi:hypothetical protein